MALSIPSSDVPYSPLVGYPDHAQAIGMISVELANLELSLGEMLGSILHISPENGRIIYLSPQSAMGRIAILDNLRTDGNNSFKKGSRAAKQLEKMIGRARAVIGKRHEIIHQSWGTASRNSEQEYEEHVASRKLPFMQTVPLKIVPLADLERVLADIRKLNGQVRDATASNYDSWPPYTSQPKPREPPSDGPSQTCPSNRNGCKAATPAEIIAGVGLVSVRRPVSWGGRYTATGLALRRRCFGVPTGQF